MAEGALEKANRIITTIHTLVTKDVNLEIIIWGAQKGRNENTDEKIQEKISHAGELGGGRVNTLETGEKEYSQPTEYKGRNRSRCQRKVRERGTSQDRKRK